MMEEASRARKLAAIMFTDMVGYSALAQTDETLALDLLEEHRRLLRPLFPQFNGEEIETAGDSFFVEFASALDAARCAVEIQKLLRERNAEVSPERRILLRIGLHLGDVVHLDRHVHGDGVNIAARIEPCARPGGICVSEDVARQIENKLGLPLAKLGKGELKNISLPVRIFRIVLPWETRTAAAIDRVRFLLRRARRRAYSTLAIVVIFVLALLVVPSLLHAPPEPNSIAVLPFKNLSPAGESEYFADGLTEEVIGQLSKLHALRVTSRTSIMQYKNKPKNVGEIANELRVAHILEGSVRRDSLRVRILVQLIDAADDRHLWTEQYDGVMTDIFAFQSDIAKKIATSLEANISSEEQARLARQPTADRAAYDLYLKGRYFWNQRLPEDVQKGIEFFKQAIALDSTFALAYTGLAESYARLEDMNILSPRETYPLVKEAAQKALTLDSTLAEARALLGLAALNYDWDWATAQRELERAIQINPSYAPAWVSYAYLLTVLGRYDEAHTVHRQAVRLDPLSPTVNSEGGLILYFSRKYDEAIAEFKKALQLDSMVLLARIPLSAAYLQKQMYTEAIDVLQQVASGTPLRQALPLAALAHAYAVAGRPTEALQTVQKLDRLATTNRYVSPYSRAVVAMGMGNSDEALKWLERAYTDRDASMVFLKADPVFDPLRSDKRFTSLLNRMGLSDASLASEGNRGR